MKKTLQQMTRYEVLKELAKYVHPETYQFIFGYSTPMLRALAAFYQPF